MGLLGVQPIPSWPWHLVLNPRRGVALEEFSKGFIRNRFLICGVFLSGSGSNFRLGSMRLSHVNCLYLPSAGCPLHHGVVWGGLWEKQRRCWSHRELWMLQFTGH